MTDTTPLQPAPSGVGCVNCGMTGTLQTRENEITEKRRPKFGLFWVLISLFSLGLGLVLWLVMPRKNHVISVDRFNQCSNCGTKQ